MFSQLQLFNLQVILPTTLTSILSATNKPPISRGAPGANDGGASGAGGANGAVQRWHTDKLPEDSLDWLAGQGNRKNFAFYFGDDEKGRKNRAALANIKCLHHKSRGLQRSMVGICADYVAGGRCSNANCKLAHFLVRHATRMAWQLQQRRKTLPKS